MTFIEVTVDRSMIGTEWPVAKRHKEIIAAEDVRRVVPVGKGCTVWYLGDVPQGWSERELRSTHVAESYGDVRTMLDKATTNEAPTPPETEMPFGLPDTEGWK